MKKLVLAATALAFLAGAPAFAQTAAPAAQAPAATPMKPAKAAPKAEKPRSAASLECSKQADGKGLHGKDRKKFRSECMKAAKAGDKKM
ncbi:MAG: PsiF family protein [Rhodoblastus sp.]|jgi:curli biogenesis system outer membrane secretion channel CsgG